MASGSSNTFRQVGIATGIAGLGAVFLSQIRPDTVNALQATPTGRLILAEGGSRLTTAISGSGVRQAVASIPSAAARDTLLNAYRVGFTTTFNHLMGIATVTALVGAIGALALIRQRDFVPSYEPGSEKRAGETPGGGGTRESSAPPAPPVPSVASAPPVTPVPEATSPEHPSAAPTG